MNWVMTSLLGISPLPSSAENSTWYLQVNWTLFTWQKAQQDCIFHLPHQIFLSFYNMSLWIFFNFYLINCIFTLLFTYHPCLMIHIKFTHFTWPKGPATQYFHLHKQIFGGFEIFLSEYFYFYHINCILPWLFTYHPCLMMQKILPGIHR